MAHRLMMKLKFIQVLGGLEGGVIKCQENVFKKKAEVNKEN